jgi:hypothetical protein
MGVAQPARFIRFGPFQLDLRAAELRRNGVRVRLPDQSIKVLTMLVESPGELVTREQLQQKLWPNGRIVEFDNSINAAIRRHVGNSIDVADNLGWSPKPGQMDGGKTLPGKIGSAREKPGEHQDAQCEIRGTRCCMRILNR